MPKEKKEEEQVFYVGIKDPIEIRRSILESSKEMLQYLQRAERFKEVRKEKAEMTKELKENMKEIQKLVRKLKSSLPSTGLRAKAPKKTKPEKKEKVMPVEKDIQKELEPIEKPKEMNELEKLEAELGEIESRLTKLS